MMLFDRLTQIFLARLVLEVFGGGGAIWGFSEVITWRNAETVEFWRFWAALVGGLFFIRFFLQISDYILDVNPDKTHSKLMRFFHIFSARMVLEVWGGAGAIWGSSEALTLRNPDTLWFFRPFASVVGVIFFIRWLLQIKDFFQDVDHSHRQKSEPVRRAIEIFSSKFVLEVLGGAGAMWGFSEVLTLRNPETIEEWRFVALVVGYLFSIRFFLQIKDYYLECKYGDSSVHMTAEQWVRLIHIFSARMVLEFFGGAGAIWGFSEVCTLRIPETLYYWRPITLTIGFFFYIRWWLQIKDYIVEVKELEIAAKRPNGGVESTPVMT